MMRYILTAISLFVCNATCLANSYQQLDIYASSASYRVSGIIGVAASSSTYSTFTTVMDGTSGITTTKPIRTTSSITASAFYGDGSHLSNISSNNYIPYSGANRDIDIGTQTITAGDLIVGGNTLSNSAQLNSTQTFTAPQTLDNYLYLNYRGYVNAQLWLTGPIFGDLQLRNDRWTSASEVLGEMQWLQSGNGQFRAIAYGTSHPYYPNELHIGADTTNNSIGTSKIVIDNSSLVISTDVFLGGALSAGSVTAAGFYGSGSGLTALPAGQLTGVVPAVSVNLSTVTSALANKLDTNGSAANLTSFPTLNQNTTGNAATATKLLNARTINGVSFDGTANINIATTDYLADGVSLALTGATFSAKSSSVTLQGNTFNGASQLVKLDALSKLPAVDGSQLTNLPSTSGGAVLAATQTFTGANTFTSSITSSGNNNWTGANTFSGKVTISSLTLTGSNFAWTNAGLSNDNSWADEPEGTKYHRTGRTICVRVAMSSGSATTGYIKSGFPLAAEKTYFNFYGHITSAFIGFATIETTGRIHIQTSTQYVRGNFCYEAASD